MKHLREITFAAQFVGEVAKMAQLLILRNMRVVLGLFVKTVLWERRFQKLENEIRLNLRRGPYSWRIGFDKGYKSLFILGVAETEVSNIVAVWALSLGWRWPPWYYFRGFTDDPDYIGGE